MKRKNEFTLIEVLTVIIILAIIALIAVPVIMGLVGKAQKSAFKDSAYALIKAGDLFYSTNEMMGADLEKKTFVFPNDAEELKINGDLPTGGSMTVDGDGNIAMAVTNGKYCVTKNYNDKEITINEDVENCDLLNLKVGDIVYYNPENNKQCTKDEYDLNSDKSGNSGCMKWYVYALDGNDVKLILDHNTTLVTKWNETGYNYDRPTTLMNQLAEDTKNWKVTADIIDIQDILNILPWYQNLEDKINWEKQYDDDFVNASKEITVDSSLYSTSLELQKAFKNAFLEHPSGIALPKFLHEDLYDYCVNDADKTMGYTCTTIGYWTKNVHSHCTIHAWVIYNHGYFSGAGLNYATKAENFGIRPVIKLTNVGAELKFSNSLSDLATTDENLNIDEINKCATKGKCELGTAFAIQVNDKETYKFYVLSDDGKKVSLIMDRNIYNARDLTNGVHNVAWINAEDYSSANEDGTICKYYNNNNVEQNTCNDEGPLTALAVLKERTSDWTNIPMFSYTLENDIDGKGTNTYSVTGELVTNVRARLPRNDEVIVPKIGCVLLQNNTCPLWLYENLGATGDNNTGGYWLSTLYSNNLTSAESIYNGGGIGTGQVNVGNSYGIRPVIELFR